MHTALRKQIQISQLTFFWTSFAYKSTPVISETKELSEMFRDIRTSTYHICRIEEKIIRTTTFHKWICNLTPEVRGVLKILWKRGEIAALGAISPLSTISCDLLLAFHFKTGTRFSLRDKRFFETRRSGHNESQLYVKQAMLCFCIALLKYIQIKYN